MTVVTLTPSNEEFIRINMNLYDIMDVKSGFRSVFDVLLDILAYYMFPITEKIIRASVIRT